MSKPRILTKADTAYAAALALDNAGYYDGCENLGYCSSTTSLNNTTTTGIYKFSGNSHANCITPVIPAEDVSETSEQGELDLPVVTYLSSPWMLRVYCIADIVIQLAEPLRNDESGRLVLRRYRISNSWTSWKACTAEVDLSSYATTSQLSSYATTSQLSSYATTSQLSSELRTAVNRSNGVNTANTEYTTLMARGEKLLDATTFNAVSDWSTHLVNGAIAWKYE